MTTRKFSMPATPVIGNVNARGELELNEGYKKYLDLMERRKNEWRVGPEALGYADRQLSLLPE